MTRGDFEILMGEANVNSDHPKNTAETEALYGRITAARYPAIKPISVRA